MRVIFGVLSLLVVVAIVGILAKKQLSSVAPVASPPATATATAAPDGTMARPAGTPQQQVQQFKQAVESSLQQARPMPEDK